MDGIRATPMQYPILGLLADKLKKAQQFAVAPGGYANPPAEILLNLLGIPAVQQTMERVAYGEPLTTGRGMTTQVRPEVLEAAMTLLPVGATVAKGGAEAAMKAGRAGERLAEKMVPQIMERGGMPASLLEGMSSRTVSPLTVYHGSPAKFERFDPTKIGSGEGAQAYGYGHYVAESPETADYYAKTLANQHGRKLVDKTGKELSFNNPDTEGLAEVYLRGSSGYGDAKKQLQALADSSPEYADEYKKAIEKLNDWERQGIKIGYEKDPNLYTIDLPDEQIAKMLDFDKPLMQQSKEIQNLAKQYGLTDADHMGGDLIAAMDAKRPAGAELMRQAGVPGIRYLDQGSRATPNITNQRLADLYEKHQGNAEAAVDEMMRSVYNTPKKKQEMREAFLKQLEAKKTSNFVVFPGNEDLLTILKRNGGLLGL